MTSPETHQRMAAAFSRVTEELREESDRGCVILAFAWMDEQVTQNLLRFCLPSTQKNLKADELFGAGKPLGDAATKIDLSLRLGLLRPGTHQSLHLFRKLRNDFAHLSSKLTFETDSVRSRVLAIFDNEAIVLNGAWESVIEDPEVRAATEMARGKSGAHILRDVLGTKRLFGMTAAAVVAGLVLVGEQLDPIAPLPDAK